MTFQVALVGTEGIVLGSDRLHAYLGLQERSDGSVEASIQKVGGKKFLATDNVVCGYAGGPQSEAIARRIATSANPHDLTEMQWKNTIEEALRQTPGSDPRITDEVIVARLDNLTSALMVSRQHMRPVSFLPIAEQLCTGDNSSARFLPKYVWHPAMTVSDLKVLALLTLTYAHRENPSSVGGGFDLLVLSNGQVLSDDFYTEEATMRVAGAFHERLRAGITTLGQSDI